MCFHAKIELIMQDEEKLNFLQFGQGKIEFDLGKVSEKSENLFWTEGSHAEDPVEDFN